MKRLVYLRIGHALTVPVHAHALRVPARRMQLTVTAQQAPFDEPAANIVYLDIPVTYLGVPVRLRRPWRPSP